MSRSFYQQLAEMTTIVADTGDIRLIEQLRPREATTNPSLITAAARMDEYRDVVDAALRRSRDEVGPGAEDVVRRAIDRLSVEFGTRILAVVEGRVSTEVDARLSFDRERTIEKARQLIAYYAQAGVPKERVLIKIASTWEGIEAARVLEQEGIHCNLTLLFGLHQAVACAEAGVTLISPFVGRILDWHRRRTGQAEFPGPDDPGVQSVTRIYRYYKRFGHGTQVMAASFRNLDEIIELAGCDLLTIAPALLQALREREGELGRRLDPASAAAEPAERLAMDEETFRRMHKEDDMARELLGEGIEGFCKAIVALEGLLAARLAELDGPDQAQRRESTVMAEETKAQETKAQLGMVGLAVMGRNLALNMIDHGYRVAGYNRNPELTGSAVAESGGRLIATRSLQELVATLERPRRVMLMIKAGEAVDQVMEELRPLLEPGDILIDGGNSWYEDTRRRERRYAEAGLRFFGVGVSGGEEGARRGPSLMPGGDREAYQALLPIFESISAKTESGPCVTHVGPDGAGHFVKMVHNGIEYADMQLIAESYDVLSRVGGLGPVALGDVFARWNRGPLESFLIEITAKIFTVRDERGGGWLIDKVLDRAGQKGTGRWTALVGLELGVPIPGIAAALDARAFSAMKGDRLKASASLQGPAPAAFAGDVEQLVSAVHDSLYAAKVVVYAQGMALIDAASRKYGWSIDLKELARIWKGGCIIRARFLDAIMSAYERRGDLANLLLDERFREDVHVRQGAWRDVVALAQRCGIPVAGLGSGLAYYDSYRTAELPQRLTQAQRDAFGSHQYQRNDDPTEAHVHTDWLK